jgi:uncharacterized protein (TIGR02996 family)
MTRTPDLFPTEDDADEPPPAYHGLLEWVALLAAVRAAPDDDLPRLVAADWLDERGEPDRAEFVRLQVEAARQTHRHAGGRAGCRACELGRRSRELVKRSLRGRFVIGRRCALDGLEPGTTGRSGYPRPSAGIGLVRIRRGFVAGATCHFSAWEAGGDRLLLESVRPHVILGGLPPPYHSGRGAVHGDRIRARWPAIGSFLVVSVALS